jgi:hypothetical protein
MFFNEKMGGFERSEPSEERIEVKKEAHLENLNGENWGNTLMTNITKKNTM